MINPQEDWSSPRHAANLNLRAVCDSLCRLRASELLLLY